VITGKNISHLVWTTPIRRKQRQAASPALDGAP